MDNVRSYITDESVTYCTKNSIKSIDKGYIVVDSNGNFADKRSIFILPSDQNPKTWLWCYHSYTTKSNPLWRYPNEERANRIVQKLNALSEIAGFNVNFHAEQYKKHGYTPVQSTFIYEPIPRGHVTNIRKRLKEIQTQYAM